MAEPYTCFCGVKTRQPFYIDGQLLCTLCADKVAPRLVDKRAASSWREFTQGDRKLPSNHGLVER